MFWSNNYRNAKTTYQEEMNISALNFKIKRKKWEYKINFKLKKVLIIIH